MFLSHTQLSKQATEHHNILTMAYRQDLDSSQVLPDFLAFCGLERDCNNFELFLSGMREQSEAKLKARGDKHYHRNSWVQLAYHQDKPDFYYAHRLSTILIHILYMTEVGFDGVCCYISVL